MASETQWTTSLRSTRSASLQPYEFGESRFAPRIAPLRSFAENSLFNTTIATAIADRLVENSEVFLLGGESLRKAQKTPAPPAP